MIMIWSGSVGSIPSGWVLCNGSNSTPDLRDKFVIGAGNSYAVAATGGSANAVVVSHTHTATTSLTDPGHTHLAGVHSVTGPGNNGGGWFVGPNNGLGFIGNMTTSTTGISASTSVSTEGSSGNNANLPPYYALCYIMKT